MKEVFNYDANWPEDTDGEIWKFRGRFMYEHYSPTTWQKGELRYIIESITTGRQITFEGWDDE